MSFISTVIDLRNTTERVQTMNHYLQTANEYVVLDIETTGFSPKKGGRIIEIAALKYKDGKIDSEFHQYINPELKIPKEIVELTGITDEMVQNKPTIIPVIKQFAEFLGNSLVIAHNSLFDWDRYLKFYLFAAGISATNPVSCSATLAKHYFPELKEHKLNVVANYLGIAIEQHHAGWSDTKTLGEIVLIMKKLEIYSSDSLFETLELETTKKKQQENVVESFKIKRVSYWEKPISKTKILKRLYVLMDIGTVFYDYTTSCWANKDVSKTINFNEVEARVLRFRNASSLIQLKK